MRLPRLLRRPVPVAERVAPYTRDPQRPARIVSAGELAELRGCADPFCDECGGMGRLSILLEDGRGWVRCRCTGDAA